MLVVLKRQGRKHEGCTREIVLKIFTFSDAAEQQQSRGDMNNYE